MKLFVFTPIPFSFLSSCAVSSLLVPIHIIPTKKGKRHEPEGRAIVFSILDS